MSPLEPKEKGSHLQKAEPSFSDQLDELEKIPFSPKLVELVQTFLTKIHSADFECQESLQTLERQGNKTLMAQAQQKLSEILTYETRVSTLLISLRRTDLGNKINALKGTIIRKGKSEELLELNYQIERAISDLEKALALKMDEKDVKKDNDLNKIKKEMGEPDIRHLILLAVLDHRVSELEKRSAKISAHGDDTMPSLTAVRASDVSMAIQDALDEGITREQLQPFLTRVNRAGGTRWTAENF